ncbi:MAG TPA: NAD(P)H-binding protein, partial [Acidimicrobiales bacterium]|nr:NAD(P)H-binding protein [Acidimicrobiales bacterium]
MSGTQSGPSQAEPGLCLVAGATGYIGSRLVPALLARGMRVRALGRDRGRLEAQPWSGRVELATADVTDASGLQ